MADNIIVKDAAGTDRTVRSRDNADVHLALHGIASPDGAAVAPVDAVTGVAVEVKATVLPSGAATETTLSSINGAIRAGYETVAASQTAQVLGTSGAVGDYLAGLLITPESTSPGAVTVLDDSTGLPVFVGGTDSVGSLVPFFVPLGIRSVAGPWAVSTGADVSVIAVGEFT